MKALICVMSTNKEPFISTSKAIVEEYRKTIIQKNLNIDVCEYVGGDTFKTIDGIIHMQVDDNSTYLKRWEMMKLLKTANANYDVFVFQGTSTVCNLELLDMLMQDGGFDNSGIYGNIMTIQNRGMRYYKDNEHRILKWTGQILIGCLNIMTKQMMYDILEWMDVNTWPDDVKTKYSLFIDPSNYQSFTRSYGETMSNYLPSLKLVDDDIVINAIVLDILHKNLYRYNSAFLEDAVKMNESDYMSLLAIRSKMEVDWARNFNAEWYWTMRQAYEPMIDRLLQARFRENKVLYDHHLIKCKLSLKKYPIPISEISPEKFDFYAEPFSPEFALIDEPILDV